MKVINTLLTIAAALLINSSQAAHLNSELFLTLP